MSAWIARVVSVRMDAKARKPRQGEFFKMPWVIAIRSDISPLAKLVFAYLLHLMRDKGVCWPSVRTIAKGSEKLFGLGLHRDRVVKAIQDLAAAGLLIVEGGRPGHTQGNQYRLPVSVQESVTVRQGPTPPETVREICATVRETRTEPSGKPVHKENKSKKESKKNRAHTSDPPPDSWEEVLKLLPADSPLKCHRFQEQWEKWATFRRVELHKKLTTTSVKRQIRNCVEWGLEAAVTAIGRSMDNDYQGLFKPREESKRENPARVVAEPGKYDGVKVHRPKAG